MPAVIFQEHTQNVDDRLLTENNRGRCETVETKKNCYSPPHEGGNKCGHVQSMSNLFSKMT